MNRRSTVSEATRVFPAPVGQLDHRLAPPSGCASRKVRTSLSCRRIFCWKACNGLSLTAPGTTNSSSWRSLRRPANSLPKPILRSQEIVEARPAHSVGTSGKPSCRNWSASSLIGVGPVDGQEELRYRGPVVDKTLGLERLPQALGQRFPEVVRAEVDIQAVGIVGAAFASVR